MDSWYLSFQSRRTLSGQVGETGLYVGGVMEEVTGSPGGNSTGKRACWMGLKLEILSGFQNIFHV